MAVFMFKWFLPMKLMKNICSRRIIDLTDLQIQPFTNFYRMRVSDSLQTIYIHNYFVFNQFNHLLAT